MDEPGGGNKTLGSEEENRSSIAKIVNPIVKPIVYLRDVMFQRRLADVLKNIPHSESEVRGIASEAPHETVTPYHVAELSPYLKSNEEILAVLEMQSDLGGLVMEDRTGAEHTGSLINDIFSYNLFWTALNSYITNLFALTDSRVIILFTQIIVEDKVRDIKYDTISSIDYKTGIPKMIEIQTTSQTYRLDVSAPFEERIPFAGRSRDEYQTHIQDIVSMIREHATEARQSASTETDSISEQKDADTVEQLERLHELKKEGALTEEEFEEQKQAVLSDDG